MGGVRHRKLASLLVVRERRCVTDFQRELDFIPAIDVLLERTQLSRVPCKGCLK